MTALATLQDLASRSRGVVTRREARAAGVIDRQLRDLIRRGIIVRLGRGVYQVGAVDVGGPVPSRSGIDSC